MTNILLIALPILWLLQKLTKKHEFINFMISIIMLIISMFGLAYVILK